VTLDLDVLNRDFLFDFPIPARSIPRTALLCKALSDSLANLSRRDNHHPAATVNMAILFAANFSSRLSRCGAPVEKENEQVQRL
jgi:hypothetical protein